MASTPAAAKAAKVAKAAVSTPAKAAKVAKAVATRSRRSSSGREETYDHTRAGARLILSYDAEANAFTGTVENTTAATLLQVRVEVHLSNGTELGPPPPVDLAPGQTIPITLEATSAPFDTWSAHPEVGGSGGEDGSVETRVQSSTCGHIKASLSPLADSWSTPAAKARGR